MTSFAEYVEADGGEFVPPPGSIAQEWMDVARFLTDQRVATGRKGELPMRLEMGWVDDPEFNAWAESLPHTDVIAFNVGIIPILLGIYRSILSDPDTFPVAEKPAELAEVAFAFAEDVTHLPTDGRAWRTTPMRNRHREHQAQRLALGSFMFIVEHEFAHLYNGHVDLGNRTLGLRRLMEIGGPTATGAALTRQTFEWDADLQGAQRLLTHALMPEIELVNNRAKWTLPERNVWGSKSDSIATMGVVISIVHMIFSDLDEVFHPSAADRSHPPELVRLILTMRQIEHQLWFRAGWSPEEAEEAAWRDIGILTQRMSEIVPGRHFDPERTEAAFRVANDMHQAYMAEFGRIRSDLDLLKRGGALAPLEPDSEPL